MHFPHFLLLFLWQVFFTHFLCRLLFNGFHPRNSFLQPSRRCVESIVRYVFVWGHKSSFSRIFILEKGVLRYAIIAATQHT